MPNAMFNAKLALFEQNTGRDPKLCEEITGQELQAAGAPGRTDAEVPAQLWAAWQGPNEPWQSSGRWRLGWHLG